MVHPRCDNCLPGWKGCTCELKGTANVQDPKHSIPKRVEQHTKAVVDSGWMSHEAEHDKEGQVVAKELNVEECPQNSGLKRARGDKQQHQCHSSHSQEEPS